MLKYIVVAIVIILILLILLFTSRSRIKDKYLKYINIPNSRGYSGVDVANIIASKYQLNIRLAKDERDLCDAYYPGKKILLMSEKVATTPTIASVAITCHELGHALQHQEGKLLYRANIFFNKLTHITNRFIFPSIILGLLAHIFSWPTESLGLTLVALGLSLFLAHIIFKIIVIPLEFNASKRAIKLMKENNLLSKSEISKSKSILNTAGQTYIVSLFDDITISIKKFFRLFG